MGKFFSQGRNADGRVLINCQAQGIRKRYKHSVGAAHGREKQSQNNHRYLNTE